MSTKSRQRYANLMVAQGRAHDFVTAHIRNKPLGLPDLDDAQFKAVMDAVVKAMMWAWSDGFQAAREE